jgi:isopenicillin-N N-acyltransferase-like protein
VLAFTGTPRQIGEAFGESCRAQIAELYRRRVDNALAQAKEYGGRTVTEATLLAVSRGCLPASEAYDPDGLVELMGIARGANLSTEQIFAMNALTDLRDVLAFGDMKHWPVGEECSSFIIAKDKTADGKTLCGQTWDLATDNMPFVVGVHRRPEGRPETWSLTTVGCLSLIGLNAEGMAIGTTNIRTIDSRLGVGYLQIIHKALAAKKLADVERAIVDAPRAGAHYYYAVGEGGAGIAVECTATLAKVTRVDRGYAVHCNHILDEEEKALEASTPMTSSLCRQSRMGELIGGASSPIAAGDAKRFLADHHGGANAICRHDYAGISSNGSIVIEPESRRAWACHGQACTAAWIELTGSPSPSS